VIDTEERRTYIGASEAAAVVGLSPWGSPVTVWSSKVGAPAPEPEQSLRMWLGTRMEPILRELYEARTGRKPRTHQRLVRAKAYPFIAAHPDYDRLEVKTARSDDGWGEDGAVVTPDTMAVPLHYFLQVQQQMYVTGWEQSDLAVLIGHDAFRVYDVPRDQPTIDGLVAAEVEFWEDFVLPRIPPPMDGSDAAAQYLRSRFPRDVEPLRIATPEEAVLMEQYDIARGLAKAAQAVVDGYGNELRGRIGDAKGVTDGRFRATWTAYEKAAYTVAPSSGRTLRVNPVTPKD
jgi:putative phage-type endonuclease